MQATSLPKPVSVSVSVHAPAVPTLEAPYDVSSVMVSASYPSSTPLTVAEAVSPELVPLPDNTDEELEVQPEMVPLPEDEDEDLVVAPEMVPLPADDDSWYTEESDIPALSLVPADNLQEPISTPTCGGPDLDNAFDIVESDSTSAEHALPTDSPIKPSILPFPNSINSFNPQSFTDFSESVYTLEKSPEFLEDDSCTKGDAEALASEPVAQDESQKLSSIDFSEEGTLGRGASGKVYRAYHYDSGKAVAMKVMRKKQMNEASAQWEQYLLEMLRGNRHTVELLGSFHDRRNWYIVTVSLVRQIYAPASADSSQPLYDGTLDSEMRRWGRVPKPLLKIYMAQLVSIHAMQSPSFLMLMRLNFSFSASSICTRTTSTIGTSSRQTYS